MSWVFAKQRERVRERERESVCVCVVLEFCGCNHEFVLSPSDTQVGGVGGGVCLQKETKTQFLISFF
jgi:hypothetical protein